MPSPNRIISLRNKVTTLKHYDESKANGVPHVRGADAKGAET